MIKNKIFRNAALLLSLIMLLTSTVNVTFGFIVTKTESLINTFTPFESIISNLLISKNVEHPFGEQYVIPDDICFDFKVDFGPLYAKTTIKTTGGDIVSDEKGSVLISVKPGKSFAISNIDAGTKVTVTEILKDGSGFTVKDGAVTMEGVVAEDGSLKFQYVNVYTPTAVRPENVFVSGNKLLVGRDWQEGDSFSFALEQKQADGSWKSLGTKTITYHADNASFNRFDFNDFIQTLTFDKVGVYNFRMTEVMGNLENVDYDQTVNTFAIRVTDVDMNGRLEINTVTAAQNATVTETDGKYNVSVTFSNTFTPVLPLPDDITVSINVDKKVKNIGKGKIGPNGFEFILTNTETNEKYLCTSDTHGKAAFALSFGAADIGKTYTYTLTENNKGALGMTYDDTVYNLSVKITLSEDNNLLAEVIMNGKAAEIPVAEFVNTYNAELPDTPQTGDNSNITFWFVMMLVSGAALIVLVIMNKRYGKTQKH